MTVAYLQGADLAPIESVLADRSDQIELQISVAAAVVVCRAISERAPSKD